MKHVNHIVVTIIASIVAIVVWWIVPTRYAAVVKISDEYKEADLAVGINKLKAHLDDYLNSGNVGINDIEVYDNVLTSDDFARKISKKKIAGHSQTYGEYLACSDTIEEIKSNIRFKVSAKEQSVKIQYSDKNPLVAAQILDSIVCELQNYINEERHSVVAANLRDAKHNCSVARAAYYSALRKYSKYSDEHNDPQTEKEQQMLDALQKEANDRFALYQKEAEKNARYDMLQKRMAMSFAIVNSCTVPQKPDKNIWSYIASFVFMANLLALGWNVYQKRKPLSGFCVGDAFSPWSLTIGIWCVNLFLCFLQQDMLYPIRDQLWWCLAAWIPLFCLAANLAATLAHNANAGTQYRDAPDINMVAYNVLWCISMCLSPMYLYNVMRIVLQFDTANLLYNIRILAVSGEGTSLILNAGQAINIALFITSVWLYPKIPKWRLISVVLAFLVVEFAMMEKSGILIMILSTLFILHQKKVIRLRTISIALASTVLLFFFVNMSKEEKSAETTSFLEFFGMYVTTPAVAFSYLGRDITTQFGMNTFSQVYQYMNVFGFNFDYVQRIQEYMYVPIPTNVYTIFQPFYEDFGTLGVAYFAIVYGALFGTIYGMYLNGNSYSKLLYTYIVEILIIQFYNENLLQNLFISVGLIFWTFVLAQHTIVIRK